MAHDDWKTFIVLEKKSSSVQQYYFCKVYHKSNFSICYLTFCFIFFLF